jgi:hypothetical protein
MKSFGRKIHHSRGSLCADKTSVDASSSDSPPPHHGAPEDCADHSHEHPPRRALEYPSQTHDLTNCTSGPNTRAGSTPLGAELDDTLQNEKAADYAERRDVDLFNQMHSPKRQAAAKAMDKDKEVAELKAHAHTNLVKLEEIAYKLRVLTGKGRRRQRYIAR